MADTPRTLAALQTLLADQHLRSITPQNLRDMLVSLVSSVYFEQPATGNVSIAGVANSDITGTQINFTVPTGGGYIDIDSEWDIDANSSAVAGDNMFGYYYLDSVQLTTNGPLRYIVRGTTDRVVVRGPRVIYAVAAGSHNIKLNLQRFSGTGSVVVRTQGTRLICILLPSAYTVTPDAAP